MGKRIAARLDAFAPQVVVGSNLPLDSLRIVARSCRRRHCGFVFWQQDIYSVAIERILSEKFGPAGRLFGKYYKSIEAGVLRASQATVVISQDFIQALRQEFGFAGGNIHVVENWAPLDEIVPRPKDTPWARAQGLWDRKVVLYTGTLGMKHDPRLILAAAEAFCGRSDVEVVVGSEGPAADWLATQAREKKLTNLRVLGFQPFDVYSDVLGSADVLISILEPESGVYSVPSKVLSYLSAGRAIVLSAPQENLASRIVTQSGAGSAVAPGNPAGFVAAIARFLEDTAARDAAGGNGRRYAEQTFDITRIGDRFEAILQKAATA